VFTIILDILLERWWVAVQSTSSDKLANHAVSFLLAFCNFW